MALRSMISATRASLGVSSGRSMRMRGPTVLGSSVKASFLASRQTVYEHGKDDDDTRRKQLIKGLNI